ncbi:MAG: App1 family protein [Chthoniobacterales bacterium]
MRICAYRGYATRSEVVLSGRVLRNESPGELRDGESLWRNLLNTYHRFETDEVPHASVVVRFEKQDHVVETDDEGYYHLELPRSERSEETWVAAEARCRIGGEQLSATHDIIAPTSDTEFGVISDLDDTVIETNITSFLTAAKLTFIGNAKTRKPLKGVAALYASLASGRAGRQVNPIFYVSSSPWNLYDLLCDFMELNEIPKGPIFLRDYEINPKKLIKMRAHRQKLEQTLKLLAHFPELPFVLIGDSGQHDAALYAEAAKLHPDRIKAIYIRDIDPATATSRDDDVREHIKTAAQQGVPMLLAPDSQAMARHAAELGLIPARKEAAVKAEVAKDHERPKPSAAAVAEALGTE